MSKAFVVYSHYADESFNCAIKDTFKEEAKKHGHEVDIVDLYKENFNPIFRGESPDDVVLDHRKRIEEADVIVLIAPIWNFRMPAIMEGWIDKVLAPPWAFTFKRLVDVLKFVYEKLKEFPTYKIRLPENAANNLKNYGYPEGKLKSKRAIIFCTYGAPRLAITTFFLNLPIRRLKRGVFHICGIRKINYRRYFAVPFVSDEKRQKYLEDVRTTARNM